MLRLVFLVLVVAPPWRAGDPPQLPASPPPFTLADVCVVRSATLDGKPAVTFDYFGGRAKSFNRSYSESGFAPEVRLTNTAEIEAIRMWDREGNELTPTQIARRVESPVKGIIMNRPKSEGFLAYSRLLDRDTVFMFPGKKFLFLSNLHPFKYVPLPLPTLPDSQ